MRNGCQYLPPYFPTLIKITATVGLGERAEPILITCE
ncbi:unnamed protein product [Mycena citricolor]|uniref:Uncharacterized protein n=1 Tax=Mycena citricolor TaxID=2018698 RepID=A0AAD2H329_9AGAR|nr:unnamed protein product [Mycena citricolor]CAK5269625.1 unnamed protein product [Mycena citricolor]CAK5273372.1 unnamed protein product [Mycena citricolor]